MKIRNRKLRHANAGQRSAAPGRRTRRRRSAAARRTSSRRHWVRNRWASAGAGRTPSWRRRRWPELVVVSSWCAPLVTRRSLAVDRVAMAAPIAPLPARPLGRGPRAGRRGGSGTVANAVPESSPSGPSVTARRSARRTIVRASSSAALDDASRRGRRTRSASSMPRLGLAEQRLERRRPSRARHAADAVDLAVPRVRAGSRARRPRRTARAGAGG